MAVNMNMKKCDLKFGLSNEDLVFNRIKKIF